MPISKKTITLPLALSKRLTAFCKTNKIMRGEEYYRIPDYNSAISFLLDEYSKIKTK